MFYCALTKYQDSIIKLLFWMKKIHNCAYEKGLYLKLILESSNRKEGIRRNLITIHVH